MTKRKVTVEDITRFKFPSNPVFSPDGKEVAFVLSEMDVKANGYKSAIYAVNENKELRRLTGGVGEKLVRETAPLYSPDGKQMVFLSNRSGENKLYLLPLEGGGEARVLVDYPVSQVSWSQDGKRLVYAAKDPAEKKEIDNPDKMHFTKLIYKANGPGYLLDERVTRLWVVDVADGKITKLTDSEYSDSSPAFSPDGKYVAYISNKNADETNVWSSLYEVNVETKESTRLTELDGPVSAPAYSPCGKYLSFVGHNAGPLRAANMNIWVLERQNNKLTNLTKEFDRTVGGGPGSDVRYGGGNNNPVWKRDSKGLVFKAGNRGKSVLMQVALDGKVKELTAFDHGIASFNVNDKGGKLKLAYVADKVYQAGEVYVFASGEEKQLTDFNTALTNEFEMAPLHNFVYKSSLDWEVEGWVLEPVGRKEGKKYPAVLHVHGGPAGAYGQTFFHEFHLLSAQGYAVIFTNPRGSTTYGEEFAHGVIGNWGKYDYDDVMNGTKAAVEKFPWINGKKLGITGGSYGGYMTNWVVTQTNMFKAAVSLRSISNMYTKYGVSDIGWYGNKRGMAGADLWEEEDYIMSVSPMRYAQQVRTPLLLIHSTEDFRCPLEQAEQFYVAVKRLGNAPTELLVFKTENHELSRSGKPKNRMDRLSAIVGWFNRYLK